MKNALNNQVGVLGNMFLWLVANLKQGVIYFIKQALPPNKSARSVYLVFFWKIGLFLALFKHFITGRNQMLPVLEHSKTLIQLWDYFLVMNSYSTLQVYMQFAYIVTGSIFFNQIEFRTMWSTSSQAKKFELPFFNNFNVIYLCFNVSSHILQNFGVKFLSFGKIYGSYWQMETIILNYFTTHSIPSIVSCTTVVRILMSVLVRFLIIIACCLIIAW